MNLLRALVRFLVGFVFLFSGFVKIIDPAGVGLIIEEYFKIVGLGNWHTFYILVGALLSISEMLLGIGILLGLRMKVMIKGALLLMVFFTLLTLYLALFNPITDCGCFGEAVKLTNWETFVKDVVLLLLVLFLFYQKDKFIPIAPPKWEWIFTALFATFLFTLSIYSYRNLPMIDFMEFKVGTNIRERLNFAAKNELQKFETILIYSKEGKEYKFSIDNIPDSTYSFIDSKTVEKSKSSALPPMDFAISNSENSYITDSILSIEGPLFIATSPFAEAIGKRRSKRLNQLYDSLSKREIPMILLTGSLAQMNDSLIKKHNLRMPVYHSDYKTLYTMNRSFGGVLFLYDATIISKWAVSQIPPKDIGDMLYEDPELIAAKAKIGEHLTLEFTIVFLLLIIALMRYFLKIFYKHTKDEDREE
ncbi:MAG: BT_3928 family protein [Bacteroidales bacterium]